MNLIDADAFKKKLDNTDEDLCADYGDGFCKFGYSKSVLRLLLSEATTVDSVEVVRCKDCKHAWIHPCGYINCRRSGLVDHDMNFSPDDFCSYGERRGDNAAD